MSYVKHWIMPSNKSGKLNSMMTKRQGDVSSHCLLTVLQKEAEKWQEVVKGGFRSDVFTDGLRLVEDF